MGKVRVRKSVGQTADLDAGALDRVARAQTILRDGPPPPAANFTGTTGPDHIIGTNSADTINALEGNDLIEGLNGADTINAGAGDDEIYGGDGADTINAGDGNDGVLVGSGDTVYGEAGDDTLQLESKSSGYTAFMDAGSGIDFVNFQFYQQFATIYLNQTVAGSFAVWNAEIIRLTFGGSRVIGSAVNEEIYGGEGADEVDGAGGADILTGYTGDDVLRGGDGDDILVGGAGNDVLDGGAGFDLLDFSNSSGFTSPGLVIDLRITTAQDTHNGLDTITGVEDVYGVAGSDDRIIGNSVTNYLWGDTGADYLDGDGGDDFLYGGGTVMVGQIDILVGGAGADRLEGGRASYVTSAAGVELNFLTGFRTGDAVGDVYVSISQFELSTLNDKYTGGDGDDYVLGLAGNDILTGNGGFNWLWGGDGADVLNAGAGEGFNMEGDYLEGGAGNDTLNGGTGRDSALYTTATSAVTVNLGIAGAQNTGGAGTDTLTSIEDVWGSAFNDTLIGGSYVGSSLRGGEGDDLLKYGASGQIYFEGGAGFDTADFSSLTTGATLSIRDHSCFTGSYPDPVYVGYLENIERVIGTAFNDVITGDQGGVTLEGAGGDDVLIAYGGGNATFNGGSGLDTADYRFADFALTIDMSNAAAQGNGFGGQNTLIGIENLAGSAHSDTLTGNTGANILSGNGGDDTLNGGDGDDILDGGKGSDRLNGGAGNDIIRFSASQGDVTGDGVDTVTGFVAGGTQDRIQLVGYDAYTLVQEGANTRVVLDPNNSILLLNVTASALTSADFEFVINANILNGLAGNDTIQGGVGIDYISGLDGDDILDGQDGNDRLLGGNGDDRLDGGGNNDLLDGGAGIDTASYQFWSQGVTVSLAISGPQNTNAGFDTLVSIENIWGSTSNDTLTGNDAANVLDGGYGDDILNGGGGNDVLSGGDNSSNTMTGGAGEDVFMLSSVHDTITDFNPGASAERLQFYWANATYWFEQIGADLMLHFGSYSVLLKNLTWAQFDPVNDINGSILFEYVGTNGADNFVGTQYADRAYGEAGADIMNGMGGNDLLYGGGGDDVISGGLGDDLIYAAWLASYAGASGAVTVSLNLFGAQNTGSDGFDTLDSCYGLRGSNFGDTLSGNMFDNRIEGGGGADILDGAQGIDTLMGGTGNDVFLFRTNSGNDVIEDFVAGGTDDRIEVTGFTYYTLQQVGADLKVVFDVNNSILLKNVLLANFTAADINVPLLNRITGTGSNNTLNGTANFDLIEGLGGNDTLNGLGGGDQLLGGDGDDILTGGAGNDLLTGGLGVDVYNFASGDGHDTITDFESWNGDRIQVSGFVTYTIEYDPNNQNTKIVFDANNSITLVGYGVSILMPASALNIYQTIIWQGEGGSGDMVGGQGNDQLSGGDGNDNLYGLDGNDQLRGQNDQDTLIGGLGDDLMDGGAGVDTADYQTSATAVVINLATGTATGQGTDTLASIEDVLGSANNDTITGDAGNNHLLGMAGNDVLSGGDGNDYLVGDIGDDRLIGGAGDDTLGGNGGIDTADYTAAGAAITVDLDIFSGQNTGGAGVDALSEVENVWGSAFNDALTGNSLGNRLEGRNGADTLRGRTGADTLVGGLGNDTFVFGIGDGQDTITDFTAGGAEDTLLVSGYTTCQLVEEGSNLRVVFDVSNSILLLNVSLAAFTAADLNISVGPNQITGTSGVDSLTGTTGADQIDGLAANDTLRGGDGNDILNGGDGDDILEGGAGADALNGGAGTADKADYRNAASAVSVNLSITVAQDTLGAGVDTLTGMEQVLGSAFNDTLTGDAAANTLDGKGGNDVLAGGAGGDILIGGVGADALNGGGDLDYASYINATVGVGINLTTGVHTGEAAGDTFVSIERFRLSAFADSFVGSAATDYAYGAEGNDTLSGAGGIDRLYGQADSDTLNGDAGNDILIGGLGADTLNGGADRDTASYETMTAAVTLNLTTGVHTGDATGDTFNSIEIFWLTDFNDSFTGSAGDDEVRGANGVDTLNGAGGIDSLRGEAGNDILNGDDGDDFLYGGAGADQLNGGLGVDTASYLLATAGVTINLTTGTHTGEAAGDTFNSVEHFQLSNGFTLADSFTGSAGDDWVAGYKGVDTLNGMGGNDTLNGGAHDDIINGGDGADRIIGDTGNDSLTGGTGADQFRVTTMAFGADTIADFENGVDKIRVTGVAAWNDFSDVVVSTNGSGWAVVTFSDGSSITLTGMIATDVDASDFLWI